MRKWIERLMLWLLPPEPAKDEPEVCRMCGSPDGNGWVANEEVFKIEPCPLCVKKQVILDPSNVIHYQLILSIPDDDSDHVLAVTGNGAVVVNAAVTTNPDTVGMAFATWLRDGPLKADLDRTEGQLIERINGLIKEFEKVTGDRPGAIHVPKSVEERLVLEMVYHPKRYGERWTPQALRLQGYVCGLPAVWDAEYLWLEPKDFQTLTNAGTAKAEGMLKCRKCGYTNDVLHFPDSGRTHSDIKCPRCESTNNDHNTAFISSLGTEA